MRGARRIVLLAAASLATLASAGQAGGYEPGARSVATTGASVEWRDAERDRVVAVKIFAPEPGGAAAAGRHPLILFSHGLGETKDSYDTIARHWASQGYVVLVVNHRGSDRDGLQAMRQGEAPPPFDVRPADLRFVLDRALSPDQDHELLAGRIDPERVGAGGHSMGSTTALAMIGFTGAPEREGGDRVRWADSRFRCAVAMGNQIGSAAGVSGDAAAGRLERGIDRLSWAEIEKPAMILFGTEDRGYGVLRDRPMLRRTAYDLMPAGHKYLVVIRDAEHHAFTDTTPWYGGGERKPGHNGHIEKTTDAFFDACLRDDDAARRWLESEAYEEASGGEVMMEHK